MVEYEIRGRCALVTINRPEARNAVNANVAEGLEAAIDRIEADDDVWVGILAGAPPVFCAGADLKAIDAGESDRLVTARGGFAGFVQRERTKPIIAAVDGPALAGGAEIVLACDLVVASTAASFGIPEVKRALLAAAGGLLRLGRKLPVNSRCNARSRVTPSRLSALTTSVSSTSSAHQGRPSSARWRSRTASAPMARLPFGRAAASCTRSPKPLTRKAGSSLRRPRRSPWPALTAAKGCEPSSRSVRRHGRVGERAPAS